MFNNLPSQRTYALFLNSLDCPYCGDDLSFTPAGPQSNSGVSEYGILRCACHAYPVVNGIPIIQQVQGLGSIVGHLERGDQRQSLLRALQVFRITWAQRSRWHQFRYHRNCHRLVSEAGISFAEAAQLVRSPKVFADYLVHRYANPSFLAAIAPMILLTDQTRATQGGRILDIGCGAGHASFLLHFLDPSLEIVSVDQDFVNLYLAKRFLAPNAMLACLDGQVPSPFPDASFDAVFCLDAFHYFQSKKFAVAELKRTVQPGGMWVFPHLHNALQQNFTPGVPLTPEGYVRCFDLADSRLFDEADLLRGLWLDREIDWSRERSAAELDSAPTLTFVHGGPRPWPIHQAPLARLCREPGQLTLNPIYAARVRGGVTELTLRWPNPVMARECIGAAPILPQSLQITRGDLLPGGIPVAACADTTLRDLVSRFVLVPLPRGYIS